MPACVSRAVFWQGLGSEALLTPGLVSSTDQVACADPDTCLKVCSNPSGCSDIAYPKLVLELLPTGNVPSPLSAVPWSIQKGGPWLSPDLKEGQDGRAVGGTEPQSPRIKPRPWLCRGLRLTPHNQPQSLLMVP